MNDNTNLRDRTLTTMPLLMDQASSSLMTDAESSNKHPRWRRTLSLFSSPLVEERGSGWAVAGGLVTLFCIGIVLGFALPKNPALPTAWYRVVSSAIGYTYFLCWSVSFYPQVISNYRRKQTVGLSADFCGLNVLGFCCYSIYNVSFYWSHAIQDMYKKRHDADVTVQSNDVAFAVHALMLASITFFQIGYYGGLEQLRPSKVILLVMIGILLVCGGGAMVAASTVFSFEWLDYLYLLSFIKVTISLIKYIPQMLLNFRRKSTVGWSIWNVLLDFTGGVLSDIQLVLDCADMGDWSGIIGNPAKFGLGFVSISFDIIFMLQHYVLYPEQETDDSPSLPLLSSEEDQLDTSGGPETTISDAPVET